MFFLGESYFWELIQIGKTNLTVTNLGQDRDDVETVFMAASHGGPSETWFAVSECQNATQSLFFFF